MLEMLLFLFLMITPLIIIFTIIQLFIRGFSGIYTAIGLAITLALVFLALLSSIWHSFPEFQDKAIWVLVYVVPLIIFVAVLLFHRARFKYSFFQMYIAMAIGLVLLLGTGLIVQVILACANGDCL